MSVINLKDRLITMKVVYYGPAVGGKTTSLQYIHRVLDPEESVELVTLATAGDKTLFFDFLPIDLGTIGGFQLRLQGYTVPGQVQYDRTRRVVLAGADGVVFVANSDPGCSAENAESLEDFRTNLAATGLDAGTIPFVIQYNKRDLPGAIPVEALREEVRFRSVPEFETVAIDGGGVYEAFRAVVSEMVKGIARDANLDPVEAAESVIRRLDHVQGNSLGSTRTPAPVSTVNVGSAAPGADSGALLEAAIDSGIQLSRLYAEVSVARKSLEVSVRSANALNRLSRHLLGADSPAGSWSEVFRTCVEHVPCVSATLLHRSKDGAPLRIRALEGHERDPLSEALGDGVERFVKNLAEPTLLGSRESPETLQMIRRRDDAVRELMVVPVRLRDELEGAVLLYRGEADGPFHEKDSRFLSGVANLAALGLDRSLREQDIVELNRGLEERVRGRTVRLTNALMTIRKLNDSLNDRVEQRTSELRKANDTLRQTQDYLMQAEKMSSLARLAAGIAHEINNPMAYVQGNLKTLRDYVGDIKGVFGRIDELLAGPVTEETANELRALLSRPATVAMREDLDALIDETSEGAGRVVRIADGIRNMAHYRTTDLVEVDVHEQIESALALLTPKMRTGVTVVRDFADLPALPGYPVLLSQVFLNVVDNAVQAMEGRGRITVRTRPEDDGAMIEITDSGPGIPEDILPHVFEPFYTTKQVGEGTGLGLYTVYQIIDRHGGVISVSSREGLGTTVTIHLLGACEPAVAEIESR